MNTSIFPGLNTQAGKLQGSGHQTLPLNNSFSNQGPEKTSQALVHLKAALLQNLPGKAGEDLSKRMGKGLARELESLSQETDSLIFFQDLMHLSRRALEKKKPGLAVLVYQTLAESKEFFGLPIPSEIRSKARLEWDGLQGKGGLGLRLENVGRTFVDDVLSPGPLLAMAVAAPIFSLTRYRTMAHLLSKPAGYMTRGLGLRFASAGVGLLPESGSSLKPISQLPTF